MKVVCYVRSVRDGNLLQKIPVKGTIYCNGLFKGDDGMTLILSPVIENFRLTGYMTTKEYVIDGVSHVRQWYVNL